MAELDLLPTPAGEIINTLIDYGSKIGVSSRGAGSVLSDGSVDPDDYQFFTFDLVPRPSVEAARPVMVESENMKKDKILTESEVANIVNNYRNLNKKIEEKSNLKETNYTYISEGVKKNISTGIINRLIENAKVLNK